MNQSARDELVELIEIDGRTLLRYKQFPIDVAILRGSYGDAEGNISIDQEPANIEITNQDNDLVVGQHILKWVKN